MVFILTLENSKFISRFPHLDLVTCCWKKLFCSQTSMYVEMLKVFILGAHNFMYHLANH